MNFINPMFITDLSDYFGNQAVVASIDVNKNMFGEYHVFSNSGTKKQKVDPIKWAQELERLGAGEIFLTAIHQEETWKGFDINIIEKISNALSITVIANGGASSIEDIDKVIKEGCAPAVSLGSGCISKPIIAYRDDHLYERSNQDLFEINNVSNSNDVFLSLDNFYTNQIKQKKIANKIFDWFIKCRVEASLNVIINLIEEKN